MKVIIDFDKEKLIEEDNNETSSHNLYSKKAFEIISSSWLKVGWNEKYPYTFTWMGRPIIQLPEDMIRTQEVVYKLKPDVIIETGIAHGGSLIFYASLCKAMGKGKIIGVDIDIRSHNLTEIESHEMFSYITLIEGSSTDSKIIDEVKSHIQKEDKVLIILDSNHSKQHVLDELNAYADLVTPDSYIVATDGSMKDLYDVPRGESDWDWNNPTEAAIEFVSKNPDFIIEQPEWFFNESELDENITHWPQGWIRRATKD
jgi:cephalosporin hydroxylase